MSEEEFAREALRALGIFPTQALIRAWVQASRGERQLEEQKSVPLTQSAEQRPAVAPSAQTHMSPPKHPRGYSKSRLEPILRDQGTLEMPRIR